MNERKSLTRFPKIGLAAALLLWLSAPIFADVAPAILKPVDIFDLQWVNDPEISPDGRSIAYVRMSFDIKTDRPHGAIWLTGIDGRHARPLSAAASSAAPRWAPDGSNFTESPSGLAWSPDGRWLAFTMPVPAERKPFKVELPEAPKNAKWADPPKLIIYRVDLSDDSIHPLTDRLGPDHHPVASPDGKHIAYLGFDDKSHDP